MPPRSQATFEQLNGRRVAVLEFDGHLDFPAGLLRTALRRAGGEARRMAAPGPEGRVDNLGLARAFDRLPEPVEFFAGLRPSLPPGCDLVLAPAVLGLRRHRAVLEEAGIGLGVPVLEVPTLPPSVPGMRWQVVIDDLLRHSGCRLRKGVRIAAASRENDRVRSVHDENGRTIEAEAYVVATGGVLMGGLEVGSDGSVAELVFGLPVFQTSPMRAKSAASALDALHWCGIETDESFRPADAQGRACRNLFVTGRTLAHWHPARELSAEGVSIVTGWAAAEAAHAMLEG
jgi:glycerol-3-phosphate dehydrogenase subunit B